MDSLAQIPLQQAKAAKPPLPCYFPRMMDLTLPRWALPLFPTRANDRTAPVRTPAGPAIFITDAITPVAGETLLSLLMKQMAEAEDNPEG